MKILQFPIVRINFWFVLGIITAYYGNPSALLGFTLLGVTSFLFGFAYLQSKDQFEQNPFFGATLYAVLFSIGITTTIVHNDRFTKNHYIHSESNFNTPCLITATVVEKLKNTHSNNRYIAEITEINSLKSSGKFNQNLHEPTYIFKVFSLLTTVSACFRGTRSAKLISNR